MAQFPTLKTGAVAQYPLRMTLNYHADVIWFLDGSEQRFRNSPSVLHQWTIAVAKLDEDEIASIESFFLTNQGKAGVFSFTDPWSGQVFPNCSVTADDLDLLYSGPLSANTQVTIRENRT
jgi:hypothetical protein